jgi:hypothetical protein
LAASPANEATPNLSRNTLLDLRRRTVGRLWPYAPLPRRVDNHHPEATQLPASRAFRERLPAQNCALDNRRSNTPIDATGCRLGHDGLWKKGPPQREPMGPKPSQGRLEDAPIIRTGSRCDDMDSPFAPSRPKGEAVQTRRHDLKRTAAIWLASHREVQPKTCSVVAQAGIRSAASIRNGTCERRALLHHSGHAAKHAVHTPSSKVQTRPRIKRTDVFGNLQRKPGLIPGTTIGGSYIGVRYQSRNQTTKMSWAVVRRDRDEFTTCQYD